MGGSGRRRGERFPSPSKDIPSRETRSKLFGTYLHADSRMPWHSSSLVRLVIMRYQPVIYSRLRVLLEEGSSLSSRSSLPPPSPSSLVHSSLYRKMALERRRRRRNESFWVQKVNLCLLSSPPPSTLFLPLSPPSSQFIHSFHPSSSSFLFGRIYPFFSLSRESWNRPPPTTGSNEGISIRSAFLADE